ncbi:MAG TPA: NAD(P)(+) transhydrogenase (Re/Si-specific) subunit beta [Candidatus Dormibacteraeota bacterium]|jgi:NAD(P) transhydrogenase subunit beta|nr:NAD(P)(+) transhydrogenase (Re/Si-specific) subunit beta [Candidatus Dormibacteraeota bacterium]
MSGILGSDLLIEITYLIATALFVFSLMWMSSPTTARRGVFAGEIGMVLAIAGTLLHHGIVDYKLILIALVLGTIIGIPLGKVQMTAVPQRTALSHAFGALCVTLVGTAEFYLPRETPMSRFMIAVLCMEVILGALTITGSLMAAGKLQEWLPQRPITYKGQNFVNLGLLGIAIIVAVILVMHPERTQLFPAIVAIPLVFGVMMIVPIGGADMPTVISLLNSYAGLSAAAMGFVLNSKLLIIAGALDGASGFILSMNMSKAMNRSFSNVLFGAFGQEQVAAGGTAEAKPVRSATAEEAAAILSAANKVVIVPGYGMAVAQAQHKVRELFDGLTKRGVDVKFGIHPVAGRMPGHMNVLLAEADIPYDKLLDMDEINGDFPQTDVALIIGANDVTNPAARNEPSSPIYGMPILDVDKARTVMVIKRGMGAGFAGIENPLYFLDRTLMLFGDAKGFVGNIVRELSGGAGH